MLEYDRITDEFVSPDEAQRRKLQRQIAEEERRKRQEEENERDRLEEATKVSQECYLFDEDDLFIYLARPVECRYARSWGIENYMCVLPSLLTWVLCTGGCGEEYDWARHVALGRQGEPRSAPSFERLTRSRGQGVDPGQCSNTASSYEARQQRRVGREVQPGRAWAQCMGGLCAFAVKWVITRGQPDLRFRSFRQPRLLLMYGLVQSMSAMLPRLVCV